MFIQMLLGKRDLFVPYFKFRIVNHRIPDENLLEEIFKLRYEVYCLERHFLPEEEFRDGLEHDDYDECSTHVAAFTHEDQVIGTVRLVQPSISQPYPFEAHCSIFEHFEMPDRSMAGEVSRLVVKKNYRRRRGDSMEGVSAEFIEKGDARISKLKRNGRESNSPLLLLGLYHEIYRYSRKNGIRYLYAAMERSLYTGRYDREPITDRLNRLEETIFGEPQADQPVPERISRLKTVFAARERNNNTAATPAPTMIPGIPPKNPMAETPVEFPNANGSAAQAPPQYQQQTSESDYPTVSRMEGKVFGQAYPNEDLTKRLDRLEKKVYGHSQNGTLVERTDALRMSV
ncbi:MAG: PEP-CTERM/exosortase system-associated acyltransferase, partial [Burkholderiaceae bacterium]|nr:PEP-CTERM/exosortase system-associated acyltransferase [Burkholderiaceae bacterium]